MRGSGWATLVVLILAVLAGCAPRQIKPVSAVDPVPLLEKINTRRTAFEKGLSGSLDLSYADGKHRYSSRVYIVAYPDGPFRLEIPAPLGGTAMVMVSDNEEILAYYPGEGKAFRSRVDGRSINPYLPFPLPLDPSMLPSLIMGVSPPGTSATAASAWLMDSGEKLLKVRWADKGLQSTYLFGKGPDRGITEITTQGDRLKVSLDTMPGDSELPEDFTIALADGVLKGQWDSVAPFTGNAAVLELRLPANVPITDLEALP